MFNDFTAEWLVISPDRLFFLLQLIPDFVDVLPPLLANGYLLPNGRRKKLTSESTHTHTIRVAEPSHFDCSGTGALKILWLQLLRLHGSDSGFDLKKSSHFDL